MKLAKNRPSIFDTMFSELDNQFKTDSIFSVTSFDNLINKVFNETNPFLKKSGIQITGHSHPKVNILEYSDVYKIIADIGSLQKEDVNISVDENIELNVLTLTLSSNKKLIINDGGKDFTFLYKEISSNHGCFTRKFYFNLKELDPKSVNAIFNSGYLFVTINKKSVDEKQEVVSTRQIEIQ